MWQTDRPIRAYLDSSTLGGYFDAGFDVPTREFVELVSAGKILPLVSDTLAAEMVLAPEHVRDLFDSITEKGVESLTVSAEALELRNAYLDAGILTQNYADDALHVAQATVARADVIVSWNFRHLVNPMRVRLFNGVNIARGYGVVVILTPEDVVRSLQESEDGTR